MSTTGSGSFSKVLFVFEVLVHTDERTKSRGSRRPPITRHWRAYPTFSLGLSECHARPGIFENAGQRFDQREPSKLLQIRQQVIARQVHDGLRLLTCDSFKAIEKLIESLSGGQRIRIVP